jgi:glycerol uptake facilitator-like aquaporin
MATKSSYLVEIVGTFFLVYAILSAASVYSKSGQLGVIGIGLVHAFALTAIIYALGYKSGAQVNPAVTIGLLVSGKLTPKEAGLYIVSQFIGAIIASAVVFAMFGQSMAAGVTLPSDGNVMSTYFRNSYDIHISLCCIMYNNGEEQHCTSGRFGHRFHARLKCNLWWICDRRLSKSCTFFWTCLDYG